MHLHVFMASAVSVLQRITTLRAQITFDIDAVMFLDFTAQLMWDEMQRLFVHRTVFDGINRAGLDFGPIFKAALEHVDNRRLAAANRSHEQQDALAHFESLRRRFEILDDPRDGFFNTEELGVKEFIRDNFVLGAFVQPLDAGSMNHVVDASFGAWTLWRLRKSRSTLLTPCRSRSSAACSS